MAECQEDDTQIAGVADPPERAGGDQPVVLLDGDLGGVLFAECQPRPEYKSVPERGQRHAEPAQGGPFGDHADAAPVGKGDSDERQIEDKHQSDADKGFPSVQLGYVPLAPADALGSADRLDADGQRKQSDDRGVDRSGREGKESGEIIEAPSQQRQPEVHDRR
jgi:hypothetical protein